MAAVCYAKKGLRFARFTNDRSGLADHPLLRAD
jgi:hypothetical protein